jgi:hypothetical protein
MPLADLQRALASLYTDECARERLRSDPVAFARAYALAPFDVAALAAVGERRLHAYVDSLDRKRASACARNLPLSARVCGPLFRVAFLRYARTAKLREGRHRYRDDARRFAAHLARDTRLSGPARALVAFESSAETGISAYPYFVPGLASAAASGAPIDDASPRRTVVIRILGRFRFVV